ncbi:MAG: TIGR02710 family CRISPR-associated CARF protein [Bryobacteraceae bacterium]
MAEQATMRGAVVTVGGSPEPIVKALTWHPVEFVLFVVSEDTESLVKEKILPALDYSPQYDLLRLSDPNDLGKCYEACLPGLREWRERRGLKGEEVYFDNTGGTKPMSSALAMAAVEWVLHYHYVAGQRDKGELGVVISGTERPVEGVNPWTRLAIRQRELATRFYERGHVEQAAELLEEAANTAENQRATVKAYAALCRLLAKLDRLEFRNLLHELGPCQQALEVTFEQVGNHEAVAWLRGLRQRFARLEAEVKGDGPHPECLRELLACARRRARQGLYDEAVARLYRAVELYAQDRLLRAFGAKLGIVELDKLPPEVAAELQKRFPRALEAERNRLKLGLQNALEALALSPHEEDRALPGVYERLKPYLERRNQSWLAHGTRPATQQDFEEMWAAVLRELGLAEHEIPQWPRINFAV